MLINFTFENFLSYKHENTLNMCATKGTKHNEHLNSKRLLPVAALFGGNGSGKSNFIDAIFFSKSIITGEDFDDINFLNLKFRCGDNQNNIGRFKYDFYIGDIKYNYSLAYDYLNRIIYEESLINLKKNKIIYKRDVDKLVNITENIMSSKEKKLFNFFVNDFATDKRIKSTFIEYLESKENTDSKLLNLLKRIYCFFESIMVIKTTSQFVAIEKLFKNDEIMICDTLANYGFFIKDVKEVDVPLKNLFEKENEAKAKIVDYLSRKENESYHLIINETPFKFVMDANGDLKASRMVFMHNNGQTFEFHEESDGTKRIFDLLPITHLMMENGCVFIIDELDRSLSTHLSYEFLSSFLNQVTKKNNKNQIIFTTHNLQFLDFDLLRKDEINMIENENENEGSFITNLNSISFRTDMDLKRAYWKGNIGGVSKRLINTLKKHSSY